MTDAPKPAVYILHFDTPYWNNARHYVGYTTIGVENRIAKHRKGKGSLLVGYALKHGHDFVIAHTEEFETKWEARQRERQIKRGKNIKRQCDVCKANK